MRMKFLFSLDSVLKHRQRIEEMAQRDYAEAQAAVAQTQVELQAMYDRVDQVREDITKLHVRGDSLSLQRAVASEEFLRGFQRRIEAKRHELRQLMQVAEDKQEALVFAAREKKTLVNLRKKKKAEFDLKVRRNEVKELDDLTATREARRQR
jgi:flagellar export protein FliJ